MESAYARPNGGRNTTRVVLACLALGVLSFVLASIMGQWAASTEWPPITDPASLRREATKLCQDSAGWHELQPAQYPPAMLALHPASIRVSGERVYVALVPGARSHRFHGYYIWPDTASRADGGIEREESNDPPAGS